MLTCLCVPCQHQAKIWYHSLMKQAYHHGNLKESLIETALQMVANEGINSITLRELSKRLGTSRSAIYRHFDSKDALMKAVINAGFEKLDTCITPVLENFDDDVVTRFEKMGRAYIDFAIDNPAVYRMIFGHELMQEREESCDINDAEQACGFHALVALIVEGQEKALFKTEDPILQATTVWSMIHGLSNLLIDGHVHIKDNFDVLFDMGTQTLLKGLKA